MIRIALPLIAFAAMACTPADRPDPQQTPAHGAGKCDVTGMEDLVGKPQGDALEAEAKRRSGAGVVRWIKPGQMVTMDFRADRLDLRLGLDGLITQVSCG